MSRFLGVTLMICVLCNMSLALAQDEINYGDTVTGAIDHATPERVYYFTANAGDVVTIAHTVTSGDLDPLLILADDDGNFITQDDDSGEGRSSLIRDFAIPAAGVYRIIVTRYDRADGDTSGAFELALLAGDSGAFQPGSGEGEASAPPAAGETEITPEEAVAEMDEFGARPVLEGMTYVVLEYGEAASGTIADANPAAAFVFGGYAGTDIVIQAARTAGDLVLDVALLDRTGQTILATAEDAAGTGALALRYTLPETAYYVVGVRRAGQENGVTSGDYTVTVDLPPAIDISLTWNTRADIDLVLYYPSEDQAESIDWKNVFYREPLPDGATLVTETEGFCPQAAQPSERITWRAEIAPRGGFEILVIYWFPCAEGAAVPTDFELTYTVDGVTETVTGTLSQPLDEFRVAFVR